MCVNAQFKNTMYLKHESFFNLFACLQQRLSQTHVMDNVGVKIHCGQSEGCHCACMNVSTVIVHIYRGEAEALVGKLTCYILWS